MSPYTEGRKRQKIRVCTVLDIMSSWMILWALVTMFMACQHTVHACQPGWFGTQCQFQCHCPGTQCDNQGKCDSNKCADGYFGPGCQYVDLAFTWSSKNTEDFLYDQDIETCNNIDTAEEVVVSLTKRFRFSWIRIEAENIIRQLDITVLLDSSSDICRYQRNFYVNNVTVDITCDATPLFSNVTIKGNIAAVICSVYISGGRNLAAKQRANQSSTVQSYTADKAVDGKKDRELHADSCSSTSNSADGEHWKVVFTFPQLMFRVIVIDSTDHKQQDAKFDVETYTMAGSRNNLYLSVPEENGVYDLILDSRKYSISLFIEQEPGQYLALCEVEIFGETLCPDGKYGLDCTQNCTCSSDQICNLVTGACSEGCSTTYGYECNIPCSPTCADSKCHQRSGDCISCQRGLTGTLCTEACPAGTFGKGCEFPCSDGCFDGVCDKVNGYCFKCKEGQYGPYCDVRTDTDITSWLYFLAFITFVIAYICCKCSGQRFSFLRPAVELPPAANTEIIVGEQLPPAANTEIIAGEQLPPPANTEIIAGEQLPPAANTGIIVGE